MCILILVWDSFEKRLRTPRLVSPCIQTVHGTRVCFRPTLALRRPRAAAAPAESDAAERATEATPAEASVSAEIPATEAADGVANPNVKDDASAFAGEC